jgi:beta-lactam-binding protein with PASTA domain
VTGPGDPRPDGALKAPVQLVGVAPSGDPNGRATMPDLTGQPLRSALAALAPLQLEVEIHGQGRVAQQAPRPGQPVAPGTTARLTLVRDGRR